MKEMRKKFFATMIVVVVTAFAGYNICQSQNTVALSDLALANVEALADNEYDIAIWERYYRPEGDGYNCIKAGSETC